MSAQSPIVSILVPTYNRSSYLLEAVRSILAQSFTDFEVIISDNCSPDDTEEQIKNIVDPRIVYVRNRTNVGPANNHNRALRLVRGKYIYLFSDDDIMFPDNLALKVKVLDSHPSVGLVHSNIKMINEHSVETSEEHWGSLWPSQNTRLVHIWEAVTTTIPMPGKQAFDLLYYHWNFISMPTVMIRSQLIKEHRLELHNQLNMLYDWDLWVKLSLFTDFYYLSQPLVGYRAHSSNDSKGISAALCFQELLLSKLGLLNLFNKYDLHGPDYVHEVSLIVKHQLREARYIEDPFIRKWSENSMNYLRGVVPKSMVKPLKTLLSIIKK